MGLPVLALQLLAIANITLHRQEAFRSLTQRTVTDPNYEFIVVGGGTAGAVVASRLSEKYHVLLIEAGDQESVETDMPAMFHMDFVDNGGIEDWHYKTVPQTSSLNSTFGIMRGKYLGGCSAINALAYIRGNKHIYDEWAQYYGAKGWSYADVTNTYMRFEKQTDPDILSKHKAYHGSDGPVHIRSPIQSKLESQWFETLEKAGYKIMDDINNPDFGDKNVGMIQQTIRNGRRLSTSSAYLEPNVNRRNLHIITSSTVSKVLFEDRIRHKRATGVEFYRNGIPHRVHASREIILSAGAIASPQILMLSGIGIKSHLEPLGIHLIEDLPVGDNLHDGIQAYFNVQSQEMTEKNFNIPLRNLLTVDHMYEFYTSGTGPLSVMNLHTASFNTKSNNNTQWPDAAIKSSMNLLSDGKNIIQNMDVGIQILKPQSRGTIRLKTANYLDHPLIDPNYHSHPQDIKSMAGAFRELQRIANTSSQFKNLANFGPSCTSCTISESNDCDEYFECLARKMSFPALHIAGSCRMGSASDPKAVVDERLRVRGVEHLRVIDASVMPQNTEPGTYTPTIMIAEHGSQMILNDTH